MKKVLLIFGVATIAVMMAFSCLAETYMGPLAVTTSKTSAKVKVYLVKEHKNKKYFQYLYRKYNAKKWIKSGGLTTSKTKTISNLKRKTKYEFEVVGYRTKKGDTSISRTKVATTK